MTKQEFEERTGMTVTEDRFNEINEIYMNAGILDKDEFCEQWKLVEAGGCVPIVEELSRMVNEFFDKIHELQQKLKKEEKEEAEKEKKDKIIERLANLVVGFGHDESYWRAETRELVIEAVGVGGYLSAILDNAQSFDTDDSKLAMEVFARETEREKALG